MFDDALGDPPDAVGPPSGGNAYWLTLRKEAIVYLDVPDVLRHLLLMTFEKPGIHKIKGRTYYVGDPDIDAEASVVWDEDEDVTCALAVRPGVLEFRRRPRVLPDGERPQVETLTFRGLSPDGRELVEFADQVDL